MRDSGMRRKVGNQSTVNVGDIAAIKNSILQSQRTLLIQTVHIIGHNLIDFLTLVEDFHKRLFGKKKLVLRAEYCITLDIVPEMLWDEVLQSNAQLSEWRELYGMTTELTKDFLHNHPKLIIDTRHFSEDFKWRLLGHFEDLDEALDGFLIKSENFQALNLLTERYKGQVKCIYLDPPYNTGSDEFIYKDRYRHSSWISMISERLTIVSELLRNDGAIFISCDDHEVHRLREIGDSLWQAIGTFVWEKKKREVIYRLFFAT